MWEQRREGRQRWQRRHRGRSRGQRRERRKRRLPTRGMGRRSLAHFLRRADLTFRHPALQRQRRRRRQGRQGWQRRRLDPGWQRRQRRQRFARGARPEGNQGGEWLAGATVRRRQTDDAVSARLSQPGPGREARSRSGRIRRDAGCRRWPLASCGGGSAQLQCRRSPASHDHWAPHYPSFLPKDTLDPDVDATLIGTEVKPALQIEGLAVEAETKAFHVKVTVSGPIVPGRVFLISLRPPPAHGPSP